MAEAARCLECGCHDYHDCTLIRHANRYEIHPERFAGERIHPSYKESWSSSSATRASASCAACACASATRSWAKVCWVLWAAASARSSSPSSSTATRCRTARLQECAEACPTGALKILEKELAATPCYFFSLVMKRKPLSLFWGGAFLLGFFEKAGKAPGVSPLDPLLQT